jgi:hypothetical protein
VNIWTLIDPWLPQIHVWWIDPSLRLMAPSQDDIVGLATRLKADPDGSRAAGSAEAVAATENSRIDRLETKLDSQRTVVTAISPFTVLIAAWAFEVTSIPALILSGVALVYLISAYVIAMRGGAAGQRLVLGGSAFLRLPAGSGIGYVAAASRLLYARGNESLGVRLNNYIWATQRATLAAAICTGVAAYFFIAGT